MRKKHLLFDVFGILSVKKICCFIFFCIDDGCVIFCVVDLMMVLFLKIVDGDDGDVVRNYSRSFRILFFAQKTMTEKNVAVRFSSSR